MYGNENENMIIQEGMWEIWQSNKLELSRKGGEQHISKRVT
jgi:hypothetical protein